MSKNKGFYVATGMVCGALMVVLAKKIAEDIDVLVDDRRDFGQQAKDWFADKRRVFKEKIAEKSAQIEAISEKLKADVVREIDEAKRKNLVEKATAKIAKLKDEISELSSKRREEFLYYMRKSGATNLANSALKAGINLKEKAFKAKEKYDSDIRPLTDMDFDFTLDMEDEDAGI